PVGPAAHAPTGAAPPQRSSTASSTAWAPARATTTPPPTGPATTCATPSTRRRCARSWVGSRSSATSARGSRTRSSGTAPTRSGGARRRRPSRPSTPPPASSTTGIARRARTTPRQPTSHPNTTHLSPQHIARPTHGCTPTDSPLPTDSTRPTDSPLPGTPGRGSGRDRAPLSPCGGLCHTWTVPELPEVHALVHALDTRTSGRVVRAVHVTSFPALKTYDPPPTALVGSTVTGVHRHGKWLDVATDGPAGELHLVFHLARAGWVRWYDSAPAGAPRVGRSGPAARVVLDEGAFDLTEAGTKKSLAIHVVHRPNDVERIATLGVEPLSAAFTREL